MSSSRVGRARACAASVVIGVCGLAGATQATVEWVDWVGATADFPSSASFGQFGGDFLGTSVSYGGASVNTQVGGGASIWTPSAPYVGGPVTNPPPPIDAVVLGNFSTTHTLTFSTAVTDPVMAIAGLGFDAGPPSNPQLVSWTFSESFTLLSGGLPGFYGSGTMTQANATTLQGISGHGLIQFQGTFTTLSWTASPGEDESAFTVGLIPAPATGAFAVLGLGLLARPRRVSASV